MKAKAGRPVDGEVVEAYTCTYDASDRLVKVERGREEVVVATLSYDGLGRRVKKTVSNSGDWNATYHWYWSRSQQVLEERNGSNGVLRQYVYGTRYVDNPVQIGINDDPSDAGEDDCETFYCPVQDANFNVTALVDGSDGNVVERYLCSPYGEVEVLDADFSADADGTSDVDNALLYCGYYHDSETGLYQGACPERSRRVRHRYLHATLGLWLSRDPIGYADGMGLYEYAQGGAIKYCVPRTRLIRTPTQYPKGNDT